MCLSNALLIFQKYLTMEDHVADMIRTMRTTLLVALAKLANSILTAPAKKIIA